MPKIIIKDKTFSYTIKKKPIRSVNIHLKSSTSFCLTCNFFTPNFLINRFIKKNQNWIYKNSFKLTTYPKLKDIKNISILGQNYQIIFLNSSKNLIIINSKKQIIKIYSQNKSPSHLKKLFNKYFRPFAKNLISHEIKNIGLFKYHNISVKNQKTRFGSCSSKGNLSFNWQIIFFPSDKFRHIICHELVHLDIKNHQKSFYQALSLLDPFWQANNKWLKTDAKKYFLIKP